MRTVASTTLALLVALAACGKSPSPAPAPPPTNPSPPPTEPSPPATPGPGQPGNPPGEPAPPAPPPDHFYGVERLDQNAECDALASVHDVGPVTVHVSPASGLWCGQGLGSEGGGHVAVAQGANGGTTWQVYSRGGDAEQQVRTPYVGPISGLGPGAPGDLFAQPDGWLGSRPSYASGGLAVDVLSFFADGSPRSDDAVSPSSIRGYTYALAPDPQGGALVVMNGAKTSPPGGCAGVAFRFDAGGAQRGAAADAGCSTFAIGVSKDGPALVIERKGSHAILHWIGADGVPAMDPVDDGDVGPVFSAPGPVALLPLLDGSLVLRTGTGYARHYARLATQGDALPAWLAGRAGQTFRFTRGNQGYAFFPAPGGRSGDCTQPVELVAPSGRPCARVTFREDAKDCTTQAIDQGWDGTVIQQSGKGSCTYRWWPGLLAQ